MKTNFISIATAALLGCLSVSCTGTRNGSHAQESGGAAYSGGRHDAGMGAEREGRGGMEPGMMSDMRCPCCGQPMKGPPMSCHMQHREMMERCRHMMQHHEQMMARWKAMESELDQKVAKMNQATGQEKVDAMADVVNTLANQRKEIFNHIATAHKHMVSHMQEMQKMMGSEEPGMNGTNQPPASPK